MFKLKPHVKGSKTRQEKMAARASDKAAANRAAMKEDAADKPPTKKPPTKTAAPTKTVTRPKARPATKVPAPAATGPTSRRGKRKGSQSKKPHISQQIKDWWNSKKKANSPDPKGSRGRNRRG